MNKKIFLSIIIPAFNNLNHVLDLLKSINGNYLKSSSHHESGTDRIAEVAVDLEYDIIVNLQGDEPFINKSSIEKLVNEFKNIEVEMASLMRKFNDKEELNNPNNVKVIVDKDNYSINFSRIPMISDLKNINIYKHIGVYAFRKKTLIELGAKHSEVDQIIINAETNEEKSNQILDFTKEIKNAGYEFKIKIESNKISFYFFWVVQK